MVLKIKDYAGKVLHGGSPASILEDAQAFESFRTEALKAMAEFKAPLHPNQAHGLGVFSQLGWINEKTELFVSKTRPANEAHEVVSFSVRQLSEGTVYGVKITPEQVTFKSSDPELSIKLNLWSMLPGDKVPPFERFIAAVQTLYGSMEPYSPRLG